MTRVKLPNWLREEVNDLIKRQIHLARMLQARLVDHERKHDAREAPPVRGTDIVRTVVHLDALAKSLDSLIGGSRALREHSEDMRHTMEFAAYCDRAFTWAEPES